jgi:hypothetical protein
MELAFEEAELAEACNKRHLGTARWGNHAFLEVATALAQLAAVTSGELEFLPSLRLRRSGKTLELRFEARVVVAIRGRVGQTRSANERKERLLITGIDIQGRAS